MIFNSCPTFYGKCANMNTSFFNRNGSGTGLPDFDVELESSLFTNCCPEIENSNCGASASSATNYVYSYTCCAYNFMEKLNWVEFIGNQAGNSFEYRIVSVIINGTEHVANQVQSYFLSYTVDGLVGLHTVTATNSFGITYTDQVDGFNSIFTTLGVDHLLKAQVVRDDSPLFNSTFGAMLSSGGLYILRREDVATFSITLDGTPSFAYRKILTESSHSTDDVFNGDPGFHDPDQGYDYFTCVNTEGEPFVVIGDVVQEPNAPG